MIRQLGLGLAAGLLSALLFLSVVKGIAFGFVLSYVAPLPVMMAGLGVGIGASVTAGLVGMVVVTLGFGEISALSYLVAAALPSWVVCNRAMMWRQPQDGPTEWYPPGLVLAWLTATILGLIMIGAFLVTGHPEGIKGQVAETIGRALDLLSTELPQEQRPQVAGWWATFFPAMVSASWLVMIVANATWAQALLVRLGRNRRPSPAYRQLRLPDWLALVLAVAAVASRLSDGDVGYVGGNVALVALIPFMFLGLAGIHQWVAGKPQARMILAATYGLLALVFVWAALAVAVLGMVRFWTMRFRRGDSGGGMEG
ncbi:MAG: DUF2232 domain-containing protein [Magnetospirillum sp.]